MKLVLFNDYRLGVIRGNMVVDAMEALEGQEFRKPQDMIEETITRWDEMKPRIESAIRGKRGVPLENVRLRPPVPRPSRKPFSGAIASSVPQKPTTPPSLKGISTTPSSRSWPWSHSGVPGSTPLARWR